MDVAGPRAELATLRIVRETNEIRFEVITATDEEGWVTVTREVSMSGDDPGEDIPLTLEAQIALFRDPTRERTILKALARRLGQLHGKDTAPLDWD